MSEEFRDHPTAAQVSQVTAWQPGLYKPRPWRPRVPWFTLLVGFLIVYQVVPEVQEWTNYTIRNYGRWPAWLVSYSRWWLKQPPGASDV